MFLLSAVFCFCYILLSAIKSIPVACDSGNAAAQGLNSASTQHCEPPSQLAALGKVWETGDHCVFWKDGVTMFVHWLEAARNGVSDDTKDSISRKQQRTTSPRQSQPVQPISKNVAGALLRRRR